jgi:hypothetical protein
MMRIVSSRQVNLTVSTPPATRPKQNHRFSCPLCCVSSAITRRRSANAI